MAHLSVTPTHKLPKFTPPHGTRPSFWRSVDPILVDESFANMALAAAESTPKNQGIIPEDLIAPHGAIFFEQMIDGDLIPGFISGNSRIRAITWQTHTDKSGSPVAVAVSNWYEAQGSRYLWKHYTHILGFNASVTDMHSEGSHGGIFHLLRAVGAVARTSYAIDDQVEVQLSGSPKSKKGGRKPQPRRPQKIRRLYLRHPEYGAAELDAARGRQNRRLHWVRGHWRKQWYPSQEIHHIRWIEGHPRGSAELGTVEGERVLIGKGDGVPARA